MFFDVEIEQKKGTWLQVKGVKVLVLRISFLVLLILLLELSWMDFLLDFKFWFL